MRIQHIDGKQAPKDVSDELWAQYKARGWGKRFKILQEQKKPAKSEVTPKAVRRMREESPREEK